MGQDLVTEMVPAPDGYPIKLVRDGTPEILNSSGEPGDLFYGPLSEKKVDERMRWLRLKLAEELGEYLVDGGTDELIDVIAVLDALAIEHGYTLNGLIAKLGDDPRGLFRDGMMMYGKHEEYDRG